MQATRKGKTFKDLVMDAKAQITEVTVDDVRQNIADKKPVTIIDVREPEDYAKGAIPGAINIPRGLLELDIDEVVPDQDAEVILYCGGGSRSALAAQTLLVMGYDKAKSMAGGWKGWNQ